MIIKIPVYLETDARMTPEGVERIIPQLGDRVTSLVGIGTVIRQTDTTLTTKSKDSSSKGSVPEWKVITAKTVKERLTSPKLKK
jgi:hypothetical protein